MCESKLKMPTVADHNVMYFSSFVPNRGAGEIWRRLVHFLGRRVTMSCSQWNHEHLYASIVTLGKLQFTASYLFWATEMQE